MNEYRILVVDDEDDLCEILKFNLEMEGYKVDSKLSRRGVEAGPYAIQPAFAGRDDGGNLRIQNGTDAESR